MYQKLILPLAVGALALGGTASAAPLSGAASGARNLDMVVQVHGCHSNWEPGPGGKVHRHRKNCDRVVPREYRERPADWEQRNCVQVGPLWICEP